MLVMLGLETIRPTASNGASDASFAASSPASPLSRIGTGTQVFPGEIPLPRLTALATEMPHKSQFCSSPTLFFTPPTSTTSAATLSQTTPASSAYVASFSSRVQKKDTKDSKADEREQFVIAGCCCCCTQQDGVTGVKGAGRVQVEARLSWASSVYKRSTS